MITSTSSNQPTQPPTKFRIAFIVLFALAGFLLIVNIFLSFLTPKEIVITASQLSSDQIDSLFLKSMSEFYLSDNHLQKIKSLNKKEDSLKHAYRLKLPYDIPAPVFLQSVYTNLAGKDVSISSVEMILNKKSILEISSGGREKFYTEIIQDTSLKRDNGTLAFALSNYENLSEVVIKKILTLPESFAFLLQPSKESMEFTKLLLDAHKEYITELTTSSPVPEFTLAEDFPFVRNKLAINSLLKNYPRNSFFFVNPKSTLLSSNAYDKVRKEFTKRKYLLYSSNSFTNLSDLNEDELAGRFVKEIENLKSGETKLMLLPAEYFAGSIEKISNLKKRGIRFISASSAVMRLRQK